jgi:formylglycine-generating enzyme required for sulfatase activity
MARQLYNLINIRDLLVNGFTDEDLRRLCFDVPDFRPVYHELARGTGKAAIVDRLLEHADRTMRIPTLLALAEKQNPTRYEHHGPYCVEDSNKVLSQVTERSDASAPLPQGPKPPPQVDAEQARRLEQLYLDGLDAFWVGEWDKAVRLFQAIVAERPDYQDAAARLREANHQRDLPRKELRNLYRCAGQALETRQWEDAHWLLTQVQEREPGYRQTERLLAHVKDKVPAMLPTPGEVRLFGGVEMVYVPAGKFWMGCEDSNRDDEKPCHEVYLSAFWIDRTPVTNQEYRRFVQATGYVKPNHWTIFIPEGKEDHPVVHVRWQDAQAYCRWRGEQAGVKIRLPTEAEWEKAARGTDGRRYPWGNKFDTEKCNSKERGGDDTTPVCHYSPDGDSPYGLVDAAGNVWEWCSDWYSADTYRLQGTGLALNPTGPDSGQYRVVRGGSWYNSPDAVRCAYRLSFSSDSGSSIRGFRAALGPSW